MNEIPLNELMYSIEKDKSKDENIKRDFEGETPKKSALDTVKELPGKVSHINKRAKILMSNVKRAGFYKKYLGRVESGLYDRYGSEAMITENKMKGDPVEILGGEARQYIKNVVKDLNKLYEQFLDMSKALESKTTAEQCIKVIKPYLVELDRKKSGATNKKEELPWKQRIINSTKYKIADIILRHGKHKIYGYTQENMVYKKFPPPNHTIVTLFVENPEEKPVEQSVTDVFTSVDSFKIIALSDKNNTFNVSNMTRVVMEKTVDSKIINEVQGCKSNAIELFKKATDNANDDARREAKIIDSIWEGIIGSSKELLSKKSYIISCINTYFDMVLRIDKLATKSIQSMLQVESEHRDKKYKTGVSEVKNKKNESDEDKNEKLKKVQDQKKIINDLNKRR